jgi:hypothetical protein
MVWDDFLLGCERQILHTSIFLLEVNVAQSTVEENLARVQLELQTELFVVDIIVASEVQERVVEISERFLEIAHKEVRDALLEVGYGEVLVQPHSALVAVHLSTVSTEPRAIVCKQIRTAFSCSPSVAWITPQLNKILEVSEMPSNAFKASSNWLSS